jgi:hypothetical protein
VPVAEVPLLVCETCQAASRSQEGRRVEGMVQRLATGRPAGRPANGSE